MHVLVVLKDGYALETLINNNKQSKKVKEVLISTMEGDSGFLVAFSHLQYSM